MEGGQVFREGTATLYTSVAVCVEWDGMEGGQVFREGPETL